MLNRLNLADYIVVASDNPRYYYELYEKGSMLFVCYYHHRTHEGKQLKNVVRRRRQLTGF